MYSGYEIASDEGTAWSFCNDFARNILIFGVDSCSSSHTDNWKDSFLFLGKGPTDDITGSVGTSDKKFSINFSEAKSNFCLSMHYNVSYSYLFDNGKEIYKFKADNKNATIPTLKTFHSEKRAAFESSEVSFEGSMQNF